MCKKCGFTIINPKDSDYRYDEDGQQHFPYCSQCGNIMFHKVTVGIAEGDYEHISSSLAINPGQIAEHKKHFPDVDVLPDGRIKFTSVKQQSNYIDKCGFHKPEKKRKKQRSVVN